jgi:glycerol uptake facilitator-like aquaporin
LIVIGIIITVAPQTGAAINPGRYTGTLITAQLAGLSPDWGQAWVYWVADVAGGLVGVLTYDLLAKPRLVTSSARNAVVSEPELAQTTA